MTCECYRVAGWSSSVARRAHNPKVVGSNPAPATRKIKGFRFSSEAFFRKRDLFPSSYPQYPCFSRGTTQLSSCGSITMRSPAEGIRPAPLSRIFCRWRAPARLIPARRCQPGQPDGSPPLTALTKYPAGPKRSSRTIVLHGVPLLLPPSTPGRTGPRHVAGSCPAQRPPRTLPRPCRSIRP